MHLHYFKVRDFRALLWNRSESTRRHSQCTFEFRTHKCFGVKLNELGSLPSFFSSLSTSSSMIPSSP
ncbi:hypothetical protein M758_7G166000 [Ceratodon purpureus]|nr:hypothetical protein KC19_N007600 [Ceratodon purpureus]KAG0611808.1 hypothetical protein M758_7G166000 [Ceratodon purpureus]